MKLKTRATAANAPRPPAFRDIAPLSFAAVPLGEEPEEERVTDPAGLTERSVEVGVRVDGSPVLSLGGADVDSSWEEEVEEGLSDGSAEEAEELAGPGPTLPPDDCTGVVEKSGGGTAILLSLREPEPQGMASPLGWFAFSGSTVCPEEDATVNRVVHWVLEAWM